MLHWVTTGQAWTGTLEFFLSLSSRWPHSCALRPFATYFRNRLVFLLILVQNLHHLFDRRLQRLGGVSHTETDVRVHFIHQQTKDKGLALYQLYSFLGVSRLLPLECIGIRLSFCILVTSFIFSRTRKEIKRTKGSKSICPTILCTMTAGQKEGKKEKRRVLCGISLFSMS